MAYSDPMRLDRIEALAESNTQQLAQLSQTTQFLTSAQLELARSIDILTRRVDRVEQQVESIAQQVSTLIDSQRTLTDSQQSLAQSMERLVAIQEQLAQQQASTNAAVERLDRILDYLIRRDGER
jgi:chromosome segregation ATPase